MTLNPNYHTPRYVVTHGYEWVLAFDIREDAIEFAARRNLHNQTNYTYEVVRKITHFCL